MCTGLCKWARDSRDSCHLGAAVLMLMPPNRCARLVAHNLASSRRVRADGVARLRTFRPEGAPSRDALISARRRLPPLPPCCHHPIDNEHAAVRCSGRRSWRCSGPDGPACCSLRNTFVKARLSELADGGPDDSLLVLHNDINTQEAVLCNGEASARVSGLMQSGRRRIFPLMAFHRSMLA